MIIVKMMMMLTMMVITVAWVMLMLGMIVFADYGDGDDCGGVGGGIGSSKMFGGAQAVSLAGAK